MLIATHNRPPAVSARMVSTLVLANDLGSAAAIALLGLIADEARLRTMYWVLAGLVGLFLVWLRTGIAGLPGVASSHRVDAVSSKG
jgi:hypothetical protein